MLRQRWSLVGLAALGVTGSNSAFVGFPLLSILFPEQALTTFAVAMLVENALLIPLALAIAGAGERSEGTALTGLLNGLKGLARNPIFLSLLAALAWSQLGVTLPDPLMRPIEMLRPVAGPVALFAVGGTVAGATSFRGIARPAILIAFGKLVLHPLAFFGAAMMVPDLPADLRLAGLINAACPMMALFSDLRDHVRPRRDDIGDLACHDHGLFRHDLGPVVAAWLRPAPTALSRNRKAHRDPAMRLAACFCRQPYSSDGRMVTICGNIHSSASPITWISTKGSTPR